MKENLKIKLSYMKHILLSRTLDINYYYLHVSFTIEILQSGNMGEGRANHFFSFHTH